MNCITCNTLIPPAWKGCIKSNICPACSGPIFSDESKKILDELREAMLKMPNDAEGLAGWLMSTYTLTPKGTVEPTEFYGKQKGPEIDSSQLKWAGRANPFAKAAGVDKILSNPKLAAIAQAINSTQEESGYADDAMPAEFDPEEDTSEQERLVELATKAKASGRRLTAKELLANNATFAPSGDFTEQDAALMQVAVGGVESSEESMEDIAQLPKPLQEERMKRLLRQQQMRDMGGVGRIRRSDV